MNEQENKGKRVQQFLEPGRKTSHGKMKIYQEFIEAGRSHLGESNPGSGSRFRLSFPITAYNV